MSFTYERRYRGPLRAVILDWAGTTLDYGCFAPALIFIEDYKRRGVDITIDEARAPMGAHKKVHIRGHFLGSPRSQSGGWPSTAQPSPRTASRRCSRSSSRSR